MLELKGLKLLKGFQYKICYSKIAFINFTIFRIIRFQYKICYSKIL
ncbi:hypothetical protein CHAB381_0391 [Campylobacter hominis ATCC BAA-381]|uniref:Uncharacterized protein n=1 Tax=Campylobacter hominis (strain ATCC BAA-381 / DSM 21671 / CCUG 45161 / LMG 19568 / NCTC 13146 / CH001A) TaxID=360107 RepID=A7I0F0_CAMHC|nr:hypothetical protein CHAB381_0391 [Campylobacter hominis ATCC BAA-381]